jgi:hypothetical protein
VETAIGTLKWDSLDLPFVPDGAEVVAVDGFNQIAKQNSPTIGITIAVRAEQV